MNRERGVRPGRDSQAESDTARLQPACIDFVGRTESSQCIQMLAGHSRRHPREPGLDGDAASKTSVIV